MDRHLANTISTAGNSILFKRTPPLESGTHEGVGSWHAFRVHFFNFPYTASSTHLGYLKHVASRQRKGPLKPLGAGEIVGELLTLTL